MKMDSTKIGRASISLAIIVCVQVHSASLHSAQPGRDVDAATVLYVSPDGDDTADGSMNAPLATIAAARQKVRDLKKSRGLSKGGITVLIRGGLYDRTTTFVLEEADSGTAGAPIVYRGCPGEEVRLSGGRQIPGEAFQSVTDAAVQKRLPEEARDVVVQVDLKAFGIDDVGELGAYGKGKRTPNRPPELFVNGQAMRLARWPNEGWVRTGRVIDRGSVWASNVPGQPPLREKPDRGAVFEFDSPRVARWDKAEDLWLLGFWWWDWREQAVKVDSLDVDNHIIKTAHAHPYGYRSGRRFYVFNLLEEIDAPGEYYLDRSTGILYLYPPCLLSDADIEFSQLEEPLIAVDGASHVTFRNLTLETSRSTTMTIKGGESNRVVGCTFRKTAGKAIAVSGGLGHVVSSCDIYDTDGGVSVSGGDRKTLTSGKHVVENCHIHRYSRLSKTYVSAISLSGCGLTARHNLIHNAPHVAILFSGNDHLIEFNELYDVCKETSDAGVIYSGRDWSMRGNVLRHNFIHDIAGIGGVGAQGVYLDDCFSSAEVTGNVFYRMNDRAFLIGGGRDNVIVNNVTIETGPLSIDNRGLNWSKRNAGPGGGMEKSLQKMPYKEEPWPSRYPKLVGILEDDPASPKGNVVQRNVFVRTPEPRLAKEVVEFGMISDNWVTDEDPGFVDAVAMDFRFKPDAEVFKRIPGFEPIPFDKIGLYRCSNRPVLPPFPPTVTPGSCVFVESLAVTIATRTNSAVIHYTVDGSLPTRQSPRYTGPITLTSSVTLQAAAFSGDAKQGGQSSILSTGYEAMRLDGDDGVPLSRLPMLSHSGYCEPKRDSNMSAAPIEIGGKTYQRGLLLHPGKTPDGGRAHAEFGMTGGLAAARRFQATVGVEGGESKRGSVAFIVEGRRAGAWQELAKTPVMTGKTPPRDIDLDVSGCDRLRLVVTDGGDNIHSDHAAWGNARFTASAAADPGPAAPPIDPAFAPKGGDYGTPRVIVPAPADDRYAHLAWPKVTRTPKGTLVVAYSAARAHTFDGCPAVSVSRDGGATFSRPYILKQFDRNTKYRHSANTALGVAEDGSLVLLAMAFTDDECNTIYGWRSADEAVTWETVDTSALADNKSGSVFGEIFTVPGLGLVATGHYRAGSTPSVGIWYAVSEDNGKTWGKPRKISDSKLYEPSLTFAAGRFIGLIRDDPARYYRQLVSDDLGKTWSETTSLVGGVKAHFPSPFIAHRREVPAQLYALQSQRNHGSPTAGEVYLWTADARKLDWQRQGMVVSFPRGKGNPNADFTYPWMVQLDSDRWFLVFYSGQIRGANSIYGMTIEPEKTVEP